MIRSRFPVLPAIVFVSAAGGCDENPATDRTASKPTSVGDPLLIAGARTWLGSEPHDRAGRGLDARDLDGDQRAEVVVGTPFHDTYDVPGNGPHTYGGYVLDLDSPSGSLDSVAAAAVTTDDSAQGFGDDVSIAGDLTGDGVSDLAITGVLRELGANTNVGISIFAGPLTEHVNALDVVATEVFYDYEFESAYWTTFCGDINLDGATDLCTSSGPAMYSGAYVFLGPLASGMLDVSAEADIELRAPADDWAGAHLDGGIDLTGDGGPDLLVGANQMLNDTGGVYLVDAPLVGITDLADYPVWTGEVEEGLAGGSMALGGDLDGDGKDDAFIGAHMVDGSTGRGYVVTTVGGPLAEAHAELRGAETFDWFGYDASIGDHDGDGASDLAVGIPRNFYAGFDRPGRVALFWGPIGAGVFSEDDSARLVRASESPDAFGLELCSGDVDGDGVDDLVVAAPLDSTNGSLAGTVHLILGESI
jgi:hypothetical protein